MVSRNMQRRPPDLRGKTGLCEASTLGDFSRNRSCSCHAKGEFIEASEEQVVREIRIIVEQTDAHAEIVSDSASNLLDVRGKLPQDRSHMLRTIDDYLGLTERERLFSAFSSRLQSFFGQYGGISDHIAEAVKPYVQNGEIDLSRASNEELRWIIRLIRSKLMP